MANRKKNSLRRRRRSKQRRSSSQSFANYESLEARKLMAADLGILNHLEVSSETAYLQQGSNSLDVVKSTTNEQGTTTLFQQSFEGIPVHNAFVAVTESANGDVEHVADRAHENIRTLDWVGPEIGAEDAEQIAADSMGDRLISHSGATPVWFFAGNRARMGWQIDAQVGNESNPQSMTTIVDSHSGNILDQSETGSVADAFLADPTAETGVFPRIVINNDIGAAGSRQYASSFDAVASLDLGCTGTLVAPDVVISARHCEASAGDTITFGDNSNNGVYTATIQSVSLPDGNGTLLDGGDVSILKLTQNVPTSVATPMRFIDATTSLVGMTAATVGYGYNGLGSNGHGFTADGWRWGGENVIDRYGSPAGDSGSNIISTDFDNGTNSANTISGSSSTPLQFEATTAPGDSGGPVLVQADDGEWLIAGVLSGGSTNNSVYGDISWWTGTAVYRSQIEAAGGEFTDGSGGGGGGGGGQLGTVSFNQNSYSATGTASITVNDNNGAAPIQVTLTSDSGDSETLTLSGSAPNFTNTISLSDSGVSSNDGTLQVSPGDSIQVSYTDTDDGAGGSGTVTDTASIIQTTSGASLVGVDFDGANSSPSNWATVGSGSNTTLNNLGDEDGGNTTFDLTINELANGSWQAFEVTPAASTIPQHANALGNIDGQIYTEGDPISLKYSDLTPGQDYEIYVMAAEGFFDSISQRVTISGQGSDVTFDQNFGTDQLFINGELGDNTRSLGEYAQVITADSNGEISINVSPIGNTDDVVLAGVAIAEVESTSQFDSVGEAGTIQAVNHEWQTINLDGNYTNPVVVLGSTSSVGDHPVVVRVQNVTSNSFQVRLQEYAYLDGSHTNESVSYIVMEEGVHTLEDGTKIAAGNFSGNHTWADVQLDGFAGTPTVMSQATTVNGGVAIVTRQRGVDANGFQIRLQEAQAQDDWHAMENISWIAIEQGNGSSNNSQFESGTTGDSVTHRDYQLSFDSSFSSAPVFLASMQSFDGGDTANVRFRSTSANGATVYVDEEQSLDSEVNHTKETVGYFAFDSGAIFASSSRGRSTESAPAEQEMNNFDLYFAGNMDDELEEFGSELDLFELV